MCKTFNTIGSLTTLKSRLANSNIHDFKSVKDVLHFQSSYSTLRQQVLSHHETLIEQEKRTLSIELQQLDTAIEAQRKVAEERLTDEINGLKQQLESSTSHSPTNFLQRLTMGIRHWNDTRQIRRKEQNFDKEVKLSVSYLVDDHQIKCDRHQFISSNFKEAVWQGVQLALSELERKKAVVDELNNFIYGALGEHEVVKTLENLSDDYFLINDFAVSFSPAFYNRRENDYIKSIQIDHILVGPSGIFLIETKNWSEKSIANLSLRSPVEQIKRTSYVLFNLLNNEISNYSLQLDRHHWGVRKIAIKNLIVLTNTKPKEEFQYVKVLTVNELPGYVTYFKPSFSNAETQRMADFLLSLNDQKILRTGRNRK